jgi:hypothetical protein
MVGRAGGERMGDVLITMGTVIGLLLVAAVVIAAMTDMGRAVRRRVRRN